MKTEVENKKIREVLAINGGTPVRTVPLPEESPGIHYYDEKEIDYVTRVIKARSPFRFYGPDLQNACDRLEEKIRELYGARYALAVSSGTAALYISMAALEIEPGDEVLVPGYMWPSCLSGIIRLGAIPRLVDIDDTFTMSPEDLERKINHRSKLILLVHMSGSSGDIKAVMNIAEKYNIKVLEDCAQCNGASFHGKPVGTFGDIGILSFQINKSVTAGEGGMIICDDEHLYRRCFALHDLGYARDNTGVLMDTSCEEKYHMWGVGARMSEVSGALALAQMEKLSIINDNLRKSKWRIREELENIPGISFRRVPDPEGDTGAFIITTYENSDICKSFTEALRAEGMASKGYAKPCITMEEWGLHWYFNNKSLVKKRSIHPGGWPWTMPENQFSSSFEYGRGALPVCDDLASRSALFKVSSILTQDDIEDIVNSYRKVAYHILR